MKKLQGKSDYEHLYEHMQDAEVADMIKKKYQVFQGIRDEHVTKSNKEYIWEVRMSNVELYRVHSFSY